MSLTLLQLETPASSEINAARRAARAAAQREQAQTLRRSYEAARLNRLANDFVASATGVNRELYQGLRVMRARSRDLARNNPHFKRFLQLLADNVIGHSGIRLQAQVREAGELDAPLPGIIEAAWKEWGLAATASASGKLCWLDLQKLAVRLVARDGEALFRKLPARNGWGFTLQNVDVNWLDERHNEALPNGNRVMMGIEVDDCYCPQAYWLTPPYYDSYYPALRPGALQQRVRVPAAEILHLFACDEGEEQVRGVPALHAIALKLHREAKYEEAELIAACVEACKMMVATPPADWEGGDALPDTLPDEVAPGQILINNPGWTTEIFDPKRPTGNYAEFTDAVLYSAAAGLGVSHASLTGNLSQVNYSSIRWGGLQERDFWRGWQAWMGAHFNAEVFRAWLDAAFLSGRLEGVRFQDLRRLTANWYPRGWAWVDPQKEIAADVLAVNNGLDTRTRVVAERGEDFADVVAELRREKELAAAAGLDFTSAGAATTPAGGVDGDA